MSSRYEKQPNVSRLLDEIFRDNAVWQSFATKVNDLTKVHVNEPVTKLGNVRDTKTYSRGDYIDTPLGRGKVAVIRRQLPDVDSNGDPTYEDLIEIELEGNEAVVIPIRNVQERPLLIGNAKSIGFDFYSDELDDFDYERVVRFIGAYWPNSGKRQFIDFLSFIKNVRFEMWQLWTKDYGDPDTDSTKDDYLWLERKLWRQKAVWETDGFDIAEPTPADGSGGVYPTSHVELEYDVITYGMDLDYRSIVQLFYYLAPIHLVLERFVAAVYGTPITTYRGDVASYDTYHHARYEWNPNAFIESYSDLGISYDMYVMGQLILDASFNHQLRAGISPATDGTGVGEVA